MKHGSATHDVRASRYDRLLHGLNDISTLATQRGDFVCRYKLAAPCLGQPFFNRGHFVVVGLIELALLRLQREQQLRGIFLALWRPGQNALENLFYRIFWSWPSICQKALCV